MSDRPLTESEFRAEFAQYGMDEARYYHAWRLLLILWYSVWWCSRVDWSQYRMTIWQRFSDWVTSAARRSDDLQRFMSTFARQASLTHIGKNESERELALTFLALDTAEQRAILQMYRDDMPVLVAFVRLFTKKYGKGDLGNDEA